MRNKLQESIKKNLEKKVDNNKSSIEDYWNADVIRRDGFMCLLRSREDKDKYIIVNDEYRVSPMLYINSKEKAIDYYNRYREEYRNSEQPRLDMEVEPIVMRESANNNNLSSVIDTLIKDEEEAIEGYNNGIDKIKGILSIEEQEEVIKVLEHIKAEEEEHIRELKEIKGE